MTPGFIDTNVHISMYANLETLARYLPRATDVVVEGAQLELKYGITTVRDSYGELRTLMKVRDTIARGDVIGPRMLVAGNIVGWGGPFSVTFSVTRDSGLSPFQEQVNDLITQGGGEELMDMTPDELRVAINEYLDKGVNFVKYGGTSHWNNPVFIGFSPDAQKALVEEVHKRGLRRRNALDVDRRPAPVDSPPASISFSILKCSIRARCRTTSCRRFATARSSARCSSTRSPARPGSGI